MTVGWYGRYSAPSYGRAGTGDLAHVVVSRSSYLRGQRVAVHFACGAVALWGWERLTREQFDADSCPDCKPRADARPQTAPEIPW